MTQQDNGGVATQLDDYVYPGERFTQSGMRSGHGMGMTLRDWFAGQALAGMLSNCDESGLNGWGGMQEQAAKEAYNFADALVEARSRHD